MITYKTCSDFFDKLKEEVEKVKHGSDARREFMYLYVHDKDIRRASRIDIKKEDILQELGPIPE